MRNLKHFGKYIIKVRACRNWEENQPVESCSMEVVKFVRTVKREKADDIDSKSFRIEKISNNDSTTGIKAMWDEPPNPNGVILAYQIEYNRVDQTVRIENYTREYFIKCINSL